MKNLKKMIATLGLAVVMMMTVSTVNAKSGMLISDFTGGDTNQPCTEQPGGKTDWGIILSDFTGVISHGFTGIVIYGAAETPVDCGVISHG
jgi:hypothetical protein